MPSSKLPFASISFKLLHPTASILTSSYCALCVTPAVSPAMHPFDCPVHPDALHPPPSCYVVSSSCATPPALVAPTTPLLLWRATLPADGRMPPGSSGASESAGWYSGGRTAAAAAGAGKGSMAGLRRGSPALAEATTPRKAASQSPTPACPAHKPQSKQQPESRGLQDKKGRQVQTVCR